MGDGIVPVSAVIGDEEVRVSDPSAALERLNAFDPDERRRALEELLAARERGAISCAPRRDVVNMHCHTFYSYNAYGHSPSSLAWLACRSGWRALASVDFDVLDGVEETLAACDRVAVRAAAGLETRTYVPEFARWEINSPGEPGVCYHIGLGFASAEAPPEAARILRAMREGAERRNRDMLARINAHLDPVAVDYDRDVLPLTPAGNATERHMLVALDAAARARYPERGALVEFWAARLGAAADVVDASLGEEPGPNDLIRSHLMKRGGVGYVRPDEATFPPLSEVMRAITACGAIPVVAWLDGTSEGEQRMDEFLDLAVGGGAGALTIIPERNWNVRDPAERELKVRELHRIVDLARQRDLPILVGTEMNKAGQPLLDRFDAEPLAPHRTDFLRGADWAYGHTVMERALGRGYQSEWARHELPRRGERNAFYTALGALVEPGPGAVERLRGIGERSPEGVLSALGG